MHTLIKLILIPILLAATPVKAEPPPYTHGDCSWIEPIALSVGWTKPQIPKLLEIIKRESGCCPRRIGGDAVDKNCKTTRITTMTHRSDSGLLQINGVHWKQDHRYYAGAVCKKMRVCTQEPLLDARTNLIAGRLLYSMSGWNPWTPIKP
jgi:hypothetical protein